MAELEALRERPHRAGPGSLQALDLQEQEIVLRCDAGGTRGDLPPAKEAANLVSQLGEGSIVDDLLASAARLPHGQSISYSDMNALYWRRRARSAKRQSAADRPGPGRGRQFKDPEVHEDDEDELRGDPTLTA
jgi:hypothetical protein